MNGPTLTSDVLLTSAAGEYLAAAELAIRGWQVCMSPHQPSFDIAAVKGQKIKRVQVKTAAKPIIEKGKHIGRYSFGCKCRQTAQKYTKKECDIIIFVGLEHRAFFIMPVELAEVTRYNWSPGATDGVLAPYFKAWQLLEK